MICFKYFTFVLINKIKPLIFFQFASLVKEFKDALKPENLGTTRSASAFIKLIDVARESKKEDLLKTLKNNKNKKIL